MASDWQPGESGLYKKQGDGYLMVRDRKNILGLKAGVDGWEPFTVAPDPIQEGQEVGPHAVQGD